MGRCHYPPSDEDIAIGTTGPCTFCKKRADAYWAGLNTVRVCSQCAIGVLPALIADAVVFPGNMDRAKHSLDEIQGVYWRAIASTCAFELRRLEKQNDTLRESQKQ